MTPLVGFGGFYTPVLRLFVFDEGEIEMGIQRTRTIAIGLMAAIVAITAMTPAEAATRHREGRALHKKVQPWHGWGNSFYLNGTRYPGGNPNGPANALNNWEGGFHPQVFFLLLQQQSG